MDIVAFLKKDIVTFLENASKYGTAENKAVEEELSSLLSPSSSSTDVSSSKKSEQPIQQTVNVTIAKDMVENAIKEIKEEKTTLPPIKVPEEKPIEKKVSPEKLDEIQKQIIELDNYVKNSNIQETLKLYNRLKLLVLTVTLDKELQSKLYTSLKDAAIFLNKNKTHLEDSLQDKSKKQKKKVESLESHEKEHETATVSDTGNTFEMPSYIRALKAIKEHDKVTALELLVSLSKQHPKNRAIKMRLREALYL
ncbi:hypothetical protein JXA48_02300 [Candidatus Woesearchaeota archaeon]|nr:hypothetical protein [Candidatus Woesearchaeota archaeon]